MCRFLFDSFPYEEKQNAKSLHQKPGIQTEGQQCSPSPGAAFFVGVRVCSVSTSSCRWREQSQAVVPACHCSVLWAVCRGRLGLSKEAGMQG